MLTNSVDERYTVEVTVRKWKRDSRGDWKWCGYLKDVHTNDQGIYVYKVQEGTWIELHMVNRGVQVDISCVCEQMDQYLQRMRHYYRVILFPREEHSMNVFRVEGGVIDVRSEDPPHRRRRCWMRCERFFFLLTLLFRGLYTFDTPKTYDKLVSLNTSGR